MEKAQVYSYCTSMINMRSKSNSNSSIVERISVGTIVDIKKRNKVWSVVEYNGKSGYIMNQFLVFGEFKE